MATLHMICGKIGAGKSTLAAQLGQAEAHVVISEDVWLGALFGDQMQSGADFLTYSQRLRVPMGPHIVTLLKAGLSVVLDYAANTPEQRDWMRGLALKAGADHVLHILDVPDEVCLARLHARNESGTHPFAATEALFQRFLSYYSEPGAKDRFTIQRHTA